MSIRKVVAGLLITAGIAIMAVSFFWCTTGERNTNQLINEFEQTLEESRMKGQRLRKSKPPLVKRRKPFLKKAVSSALLRYRE